MNGESNMTKAYDKIMITILRLKDAGWSDDDIIIGLRQHKRWSPGIATQAVVSALSTRGVKCFLVDEGEDEDGYGRYSIDYGAEEKPSKPHLRLVGPPEGSN